jgi:hypothetical protein
LDDAEMKKATECGGLFLVVVIEIEAIALFKSFKVAATSSTRFQPRKSGSLLGKLKIADLRLGEVFCYARQNFAELTVGHNSDPFDLSMMIGDKSKM